MTAKKRNQSDPQQRIEELETICMLWIASGEAKDERIAELEARCEQLSMRVARLTRMVGLPGQRSRLRKVV